MISLKKVHKVVYGIVFGLALIAFASLALLGILWALAFVVVGLGIQIEGSLGELLKKLAAEPIAGIFLLIMLTILIISFVRRKPVILP